MWTDPPKSTPGWASRRMQRRSRPVPSATRPVHRSGGLCAGCTRQRQVRCSHEPNAAGQDGNRGADAVVAHRVSTGHTVTIGPSEAHIEVRLDGELLAETDRAMRLDETGLPARFYIPKDDVRMDLLRSAPRSTRPAPSRERPPTGRRKFVARPMTESSGRTSHRSRRLPHRRPPSLHPNRTRITVDGDILTP